jgi:AcrR family transcriptional regulator
MNAVASSDRRTDILQAALACFQEVGIEATSIDMVRQRSQASVGSIYHHFGSKEGIVAALYFDALDAQTHSMGKALAKAKDARGGVRGLVLGYVDWVMADPDRARYLFEARALVAQGPQADLLKQRALARNAALLAWFQPYRDQGALVNVPCELMPALVLGPAQSYCRAWLHSPDGMSAPKRFRESLADAAWRAVGQLSA